MFYQLFKFVNQPQTWMLKKMKVLEVSPNVVGPNVAIILVNLMMLKVMMNNQKRKKKMSDKGMM